MKSFKEHAQFDNKTQIYIKTNQQKHKQQLALALPKIKLLTPRR